MHVRGAPFLAHRLANHLFTLAPRVSPATTPRIFVSAPRPFTATTFRSAEAKKMGNLLSRAGKNDAGQAEPDLWIVVGLGNPGPRYEDTRHNVGFMVVDAMAMEAGVKTDRLQANCAVGRGRLFDKKVLFAKPMTFMNVSGEGVIKLSKYYGVPPQQIIVVYDDLDTAVATVRLRGKGGHGGHNGIRSLIQHLGTNEFPRVKVGIGRPREGMQVASYVLQNFSKPERELIDEAVRTASDAVKAALVLGVEKAVSGVRVDANGQPVAPKMPHQNGKGIKQPKGPRAGGAAAGKETGKAAGAEPQQGVKVVEKEVKQTEPMAALGAALAAAAAAQNSTPQQ